MGPLRHFQLTELGVAEVDLTQLLNASGMPRESLTAALQPLIALDASWKAGGVVLRAGLTVGTVQIGGLRVDVRPRLAAAEMTTLIRYAFGGAVGAWRRSHVASGRTGLDELVCGVFADELSALRQMGLSRNYVNRRQPLSVLRGRPDFIASFPWNDRGMTSITCRYHELTCDNLDNQLLRAALERGTLMETSVATRRRLLEHRHVWSEVASLRSVSRADFAEARERYTRLSTHYRLAHNLAELIVLGRRPSSLYKAGSLPTGGVSLDMAELFELFVNRLISTYLKRRGLAVRSQQSDRGALLDRDGYRYRSVRPDVVVYRGELPVAVVDAKYKNYWPAAADKSPLKRISNEDLYQLFFYAQRLQLRHGLTFAPAAFIFAPLPAADERDSTVICERFTVVRWQAGTQAGCDVALVLLPLTDILRRLSSRDLNCDLLPVFDQLRRL